MITRVTNNSNISQNDTLVCGMTFSVRFCFMFVFVCREGIEGTYSAASVVLPSERTRGANNASE